MLSLNKFQYIFLIYLLFQSSNLKGRNFIFPPFSAASFEILFLKILSTENYDDIPQIFDQSDLLSDVDDFIKIPKGGLSWSVFGETEMIEYSFEDDEGMQWVGVKPKFKNEIQKLDGKQVLIQGYMFPLEQSEKQSLFLLGPFPVSCPYHPHTSSNLIIEVHAKSPILYSYEAVNIKGKLELVQNDEKYNIFFRLNDSIMIQ